MLSPMKILILGVIIYVLYKLVSNDKGKRTKNDAKVKEQKIASGELVKDPICGTYVDAENSVTVRDGKKVHRFCSYECRQKFLDELEDSGREIPQLASKDEE